jgi:Ca2+-binding EF-hand superfamily protein
VSHLRADCDALIDCKSTHFTHFASLADMDRRKGVDIRAAFAMFDLSRTGLISRASFREAMKRLQVSDWGSPV